MKASDVIVQLMSALPLHTDLFNDTFTITSITSVGTLATAITATPHNLTANDIITITGATAPIVISSFARNETVGTIVTATNHDFTFSNNEKAEGFTQDAIVTGANEAEFNGSFPLRASLNVISVPNRRTLIVDMADSGALTATGAPILQNGNAFGYNGTFNATIIDTTTFEYTLEVALPLPAGGTPILNAGFRISGAITPERFYQDSYTAQPPNKLWACVIVNESVASKQREDLADSTAQYGSKNTYFRQELVQGMTVIVVQSMGSSLSGLEERDLIEQIVAPALLESILTVNFPTYFESNDDKRLVFNLHSVLEYNRARYTHQFIFEQDVQILAEDTAPQDFNVALRDIFVTYTTKPGNQPRTIAIDTDEVPL